MTNSRKWIWVIFWCLLALGVLIFAGCGKPRFPKAPIKPVNEFSLGTAKFKPFVRRPTAQELFDRMLEFYDSFSSAAVSWRQSEHHFGAQPVEPGGAVEGIKEKTGTASVELRYVKPDKLLYKRDGDSPLTEVINGSVHLFYVPEQEICFRSRPGARNKIPSHLLARYLDLVPGDGREYSSLQLLRETKVGSADVYLLEAKLPSKVAGTRTLPAEVRRFYIGKSDLLLRRTEIKEIADGVSTGASENRRTYQFLGFIANSLLSDDLFPTECPKNIRVATMPSSGLPR